MIQILSIGQPSPAWAQTAFATYAKRLQGHWQCELHTIPSVKNPNPDQCKQQEAHKLLSAMNKSSGGLTIALDPQGQSLDSLAFTQLIERGFERSTSISFIIGGAHGLGDEILCACDRRISLSALTFPHVFARVILIEQIYRAWSISHHHPYHK